LVCRWCRSCWWCRCCCCWCFYQLNMNWCSCCWWCCCHVYISLMMHVVMNVVVLIRLMNYIYIYIYIYYFCLWISPLLLENVALRMGNLQVLKTSRMSGSSVLGLWYVTGWETLLCLFIPLLLYPHFGPKNTRSIFFAIFWYSQIHCVFYCAPDAYCAITISNFLAFKTTRNVFLHY